MPLEELRPDANIINLFCSSRGYGPETKEFLLEKAKDRQRAFDSLAEHRGGFRPIDDRWCEGQIELMEEQPRLPF